MKDKLLYSGKWRNISNANRKLDLDLTDPMSSIFGPYLNVLSLCMMYHKYNCYCFTFFRRDLTFMAEKRI